MNSIVIILTSSCGSMLCVRGNVFSLMESTSVRLSPIGVRGCDDGDDSVFKPALAYNQTLFLDSEVIFMYGEHIKGNNLF